MEADFILVCQYTDVHEGQRDLLLTNVFLGLFSTSYCEVICHSLL